MSEHLIQVKELKKYYNKGTIKALDGITVDIDKGGRHGGHRAFRLRQIHFPALLEPAGRAYRR